jgi:hypothetical protein
MSRPRFQEDFVTHTNLQIRLSPGLLLGIDVPEGWRSYPNKKA